MERERQGIGDVSAPDIRGTLLSTEADPLNGQALYIWEEGNAPANHGFEDFRPYITSYPVPEGTAVKGAVLICPGGAFIFRTDDLEGVQVARALAARGYQSFVVDYRLDRDVGALDLARAVRFVRKNADVYGIDPANIAVMGFSAGGILAGKMLLSFDGYVNGTVMDEDYVPDELDEISADAGAVGMIYSGYGDLGLAEVDEDLLRQGDLPPAYYCYGTEDPFVRQCEANSQAVRNIGVDVTVNVLQGMGHGFGALGGWIDPYAEWLENTFAGNSSIKDGEIK